MKADISNEGGNNLNNLDADDENGNGLDPVDYAPSQESIEYFGTRIGIYPRKDVTDEGIAEADGVPRRCDRLKDREDVRVEDLAKEWAAAKNNYGESSLDDFPNNNSLMHLTSLVGIGLGCSIETIEHNLDIIRQLEIARKNIF